jgi:hypothetical protein
MNVLFVTEMYTYDMKDISNMDSRERFKHARNEILAFYMIDKDLKMKARRYYTKQIDDFEYMVSVMVAKPDKPVLPRFMNPVIQEFARLKRESEKV